MKLAKLSLAALMALGVSAFADVQNIKVSGDAKLFYATQDASYQAIGVRKADGNLFSKNDSAGQVAVDLAVSADLAEGVKGKIGVTMLNTLGLENNLVSAVWDGGLNNQWWVSEAWLAKTFGNTTVKIGRQELDTPLAFSEKWSIAENTFDAAVVLNNDLPQTTLVAAWIGQGNNAGGVGTTDVYNYNTYFAPYFGKGPDAPIAAYGGVVNSAESGADPFGTFGKRGAYAFAAVTKLIPMTTAQIWYYDVDGIAQAWWLQGDVDLKAALPGLTFGVQYANINPDKKFVGATNDDTSDAWAVKLGYGVDNLKLSAAYSKTKKKGFINIANTAGAQSKLYTEAWWNYGYVGAPNTRAWNVSAQYAMEDVADFGAYYTDTKQKVAKHVANKRDMKEFTLTASKSFGNLDATLAYIYTKADDQNQKTPTTKGDSYNTVQVYLTYNF